MPKTDTKAWILHIYSCCSKKQMPSAVSLRAAANLSVEKLNPSPFIVVLPHKVCSEPYEKKGLFGRK